MNSNFLQLNLSFIKVKQRWWAAYLQREVSLLEGRLDLVFIYLIINLVKLWISQETYYILTYSVFHKVALRWEDLFEVWLINYSLLKVLSMQFFGLLESSCCRDLIDVIRVPAWGVVVVDKKEVLLNEKESGLLERESCNKVCRKVS